MSPTTIATPAALLLALSCAALLVFHAAPAAAEEGPGDPFGALVDAGAELPPGVTVRGDVVRAVRWSDRLGEHVAVFATELAPPRREGISGVASLRVSVFTKGRYGFQRVKTWVERDGPCEGSRVTLAYGHFGVTDLDGDGQGELGFGLHFECPHRYMFTVSRGAATWRAHYSAVRYDECSPLYRYTLASSDFTRAPRALRAASALANP